MDSKRLFTSCFGFGFSPIAPGTCGSLLPVILFSVLMALGSLAGATAAALLISGLFFSAVCIKYTPYIAKLSDKTDASEIVADEYAGQALALLIAMIALDARLYPLTTAFSCFILFRLFDVAKPWPINLTEKLPEGIGVLADDLAAGIYAGVCYLLIDKAGWIAGLDNVLFGGEGLTVGYAFILGVVQGLTEFLPVSSSGHLVFFEHFIPQVDPDTPEMLLFDLAIHVATLVAIFGIYVKDIKSFGTSFIDVKRFDYSPMALYKRNPAWRFLILAAVSTLVTLVVYKLFEETFKNARQLPVVVGMWFVTGTLLMITDRKKNTKIGLKQFSLLMAVIIGVAQAAAIFPGISRSGATICAAILLGLRRRWAVEYSFLIVIPAILGGTIIELYKNPGLLGGDIVSTPSLIVGMIASCIVGMISLKLLIFLSQKRKLKIFAIYCYAIATVSLIYLLFQ